MLKKMRIYLLLFLVDFSLITLGQNTDSISIHKQIYKIDKSNGDTIFILTVTDDTNIDSLNLALEILNKNTKAKEWEYIIEERMCSKPLIVKAYKFHSKKTIQRELQFMAMKLNIH